MDFINSLSNTIVSLVTFFIDSILGIVNLFNFLVSLLGNLVNLFLGFFPSFVLPFFMIGFSLSILLFFLNRGRQYG